MGALAGEIEQVSQEAIHKYERGIIGFDEEDKRAKQRAIFRANKIIQLPKGNYIFCDFKTLELPGIQVINVNETMGILIIVNEFVWHFPALKLFLLFLVADVVLVLNEHYVASPSS